MDQVQEIDVEQIMGRIRENIRRRRGAEGHPVSGKHTSPFDDGQAAADFAYLHSGYDIRHGSFVSHRRMLGRLAVAVKQLLARLLTPILERQSAYNAAGGTNSMVSVDALQEFRILTSSYAPEYGRTPGAQVLLVTRSGTNAFHGAVFNYFRNDKLDAADWFVDQAGQSKPPLRSNDFGGVFGGPVVRDKTFFFVSYEGQRLVQPQFAVSAVPSLAAREAAPPVAQPLLNAFPIPNGPDLGNDQALFSAGYSNPLSTDSSLIKVDQNFSSKLRAFGTLTYAPSGKTSRSNSGTASLADSASTKARVLDGV